MYHDACDACDAYAYDALKIDVQYYIDSLNYQPSRMAVTVPEKYNEALKKLESYKHIQNCDELLEKFNEILGEKFTE